MDKDYQYEGYFPIPNDFNKERLRSYLKYMEGTVVDSLLKAGHDLLDSIDFLPESILHRAMINFNKFYATVRFDFTLDDYSNYMELTTKGNPNMRSQITITKFSDEHFSEDIRVLVRNHYGELTDYLFSTKNIKRNPTKSRSFVKCITRHVHFLSEN